MNGINQTDHIFFTIRELFGKGTLWDIPVWKGILPQIRILSQPAGGLILFGCLLALLQWAGDRIFLDLMQKNVPFFSLKLRYEGETLAEAVLNGTPLAI